jgi:hypothetical protein
MRLSTGGTGGLGVTTIKSLVMAREVRGLQGSTDYYVSTAPSRLISIRLRFVVRGHSKDFVDGVQVAGAISNCKMGN